MLTATILVQNRINYTPKVSVVIPVYNVENYLRECLDSVCNQTLKEIEIICINDGSTDNSLSILNEYAKKDHRITLISQKNEGQSSARNQGLEIATGEYIYFLDSDDKIVPAALEKLFKLAETFNAELLFFDGDSFFETPKLEKEKQHYKTYYHTKGIYPKICTGDEIVCLWKKFKDFRTSPVTEFFSRKFLKKNKIYFFKGIIHEDNIFTLQALSIAKRVHYSRERLFLRRVRENSTMTMTDINKHLDGYTTTLLVVKKIFDQKRKTSKEYAHGWKKLVERFQFECRKLERQSPALIKEKLPTKILRFLTCTLLKKKYNKVTMNATFIGLGYIGLPTAIIAAKAGVDVRGCVS